MSTDNLDLTALRRIAESVCVPEPWAIWHDLDHQGFKTVGDAESYAEVLADGQADEADPIAHVYTDDLAEHIAAFDPPTVLALLDRIETLEAERDEAALIADAQRIRGDDIAYDLARAEARLARVADLVMDTDGGWLSGDDFDGLAGAIQEVIRAVAADEQEATDA